MLRRLFFDCQGFEADLLDPSPKQCQLVINTWKDKKRGTIDNTQKHFNIKTVFLVPRSYMEGESVGDEIEEANIAAAHECWHVKEC